MIEDINKRISIWPAEKQVRKAVTELRPFEKNSRTHSADQIDQICASIAEWGWTMPILIDDTGLVLAGHARLLAAQKLGFSEVPCIVADGWSDAQKRAYVIADNRLSENAGWDESLLAAEFGDLKATGFDLTLTGFTLGEIGKLTFSPEDGQTDDDAVPETPATPRSQPGDVWMLGEHRVMCGDSTDQAAVTALMDGGRADMVFTSPPYNADAKAGQGDIFNGKKPVKLYSDGYKDNLPSSDYVDFVSTVLENCFGVTDGYIFWNVSYNAKSRFEYIEHIKMRLPFLIEQVCWKKSSTIPFKGSLMRDWEPIYIFSTNKQPLSLKEVTSNFWEISNTGSQAENHKACFPVALPEKGISIISVNTNIVFDPFGGSGSTLIACEKTGRHCRMMELDPVYCDVIVKRWQDFTGEKARHAVSGEAFDGNTT